MKIKNLNFTGEWVDFARVWNSDNSRRLQAKVGAETVNGKCLTVTFKMDFDCIPYIIQNLKKAWETERQLRTEAINSVDNALGI